jgi:hypothetical protein
MQFVNLLFMTTDWASVPQTEHPGGSGMVLWRTVEAGELFAAYLWAVRGAR